MPWLSAITVVRDDPAGFARTVQSLSQQEVDDVGLVVIDSSVDRNEVPRLLDASGLGFPVDYAHEQPRGIYAAMNTALERCTGDYAYFLNAGDVLVDPYVLGRVREAFGEHPVWGFGPVQIVERDGGVVVTPPWDYAKEKAVGFSRGLFPPHQGTFAAVQALRQMGGFDESYRVAADYAMFLRLSQMADPVALPFVLATFHEGGTSTRRWQESFREFHRARTEILRPQGAAALRERWETARHYALVFAHREVRSRLSWRQNRSS